MKPPTTGLQRAIQLGEVPPEKWHTMIGRTLIGALFVVLGVGLLALSGYVILRTETVSVLVGTMGAVGLVMVIVGATVWSTQVVTRAIGALLNPAKAIREIIKGTK